MKGFGLSKEDESFTVAVGDYNNDGYPDLLLVAKEDAFFGTTLVKLLESIPCDTNCNSGAQESNRRYFKLVETGTEQISKISRAVKTTFLDYNNDV